MSVVTAESRLPWKYVILAWLILFPYYNQLAPSSYDNTALDDIVATAKTGNATNQALAVVLGLMGIVSLVQSGKPFRPNSLVGGLFLLYVTWIGLSVFWADDPSATIRRQAAFGLLLLFCAGCSVQMAKRSLMFFVVGLAGLNMIAALIQEFVRGTLQPFALDNRFGGTVSPNVQAASMSVAVIILLWSSWQTPARRAILLTAGVVFLIFIAMTGSRTSALGLVAVLVFSLLLIGIKTNRVSLGKIAAVGLFTLFVICLAALFNASSGPLLETGGVIDILRNERDYGEVSDLSGRRFIWEICVRYAIDRPMLGYGYGGFWTASRLNAVADELKWPAHHAHSAYLDLLLQLGIPGSSLYILFLITATIVCTFRFFAADTSYGTWAALLVFLTVNGLTESIVILPTFPGFVLTLLSVNLSLTRVD